MSDEKAWKPLELVKVSSDYLAAKGVPGPRLDAEILLCAVLGLKRRVDLYAGFEREVAARELAEYRDHIRRRSAREPVSRILGRREFMGIEFAVTPDVLSPRPETELLVEAVLERALPAKKTVPPDDPPDDRGEAAEGEAGGDDAMAAELARLLDSYAEDAEDDGGEHPSPPPRRDTAEPARNAPARPRGKAPPPKAEGPALTVLDLGSGSGCIAVAVAAKLPNARVVAADASPKALAVARKNASRAGVAERMEFRQGDWFAACREGERFDFILSNPPYLVEGDPDIWPEASRYDPPAALYGGRDGLDCYRRIVPDAPEWLAPDGWIFLEVGAGQSGRVADLLSRRGFREVGILSDYGGVERVVKAMAPEA